MCRIAQVEPVVARYDLDNIRLSEVAEGDSVFARFALTNILVEGVCLCVRARGEGVQG